MPLLVSAMVAWVIAIAGVWLMTTAGRSRPQKPIDPAFTQVVEYGGVVRAANGPVPFVLWTVYTAVAVFAMVFAVAVGMGWYEY